MPVITGAAGAGKITVCRALAGQPGIVVIVAAELVGTGAQNRRLYEARGLLEPERSDGAALQRR